MAPFQKVRPFFQDEIVSVGLVPSGRFGTSGKIAASPAYKPFILRKTVVLGFVALLLLLAAVVQILNGVINYHFHGLGPVTSTTSHETLTHYFWSAPTVVMILLSASITATLASLDFSLKRIEPYRQLAMGHVSADHSLLLDYLGTPQFHVWRQSFKNRHWIVFISSVACLLSLTLSPLSSTLFVIGSSDNVQSLPVTLTQSFGLPLGWDALIPSYSAANTVASLFLANGSLPAYVNSEWAVSAFTSKTTGQAGTLNGTLNGALPAIRSFANCEDTNIQWEEISRQAYYRFNATITGKVSGKSVNYNNPGYAAFGRTMFNATVMPLNGQVDPRFQSFVYQIFTPLTEDPSQATTVGPPNMSVIICNPTAQVQEAAVSLDSATRALLSALPVGGSEAKNLTFLNSTGSTAMNGFYFNVSQYGPIVEKRKEATMFGLVSVMYQAAIDYPGGIEKAYADDAHFNLTKTIYQNYLSLMALGNYLENTAPSDALHKSMSSVTLQNLLFVSFVSAVLISSILIILAILVVAAFLQHRRTFAKVGLRATPGSMAGTGMTLVGGDVAVLLDDPDTTRREMKAALRRYKWSLVDGKVCADGGLTENGNQQNAGESSLLTRGDDGGVVNWLL